MSSGSDDAIDTLTSAGDLNIGSGSVLTLNGGVISGGDGSASTGTIALASGAASTLQIAGDFDFGGTIELTAGSTLALAGAGTQFDLGTLSITGNSTLDFGAGVATTLNLDNLFIAPGVTLTVTNWMENIDLWTASFFDGATINVRDDDTAQIVFSGYSGGNTIWQTGPGGAFPAFPGEITVPEPSTYGAFLMGSGLALWTLRRKRRSYVPAA